MSDREPRAHLRQVQFFTSTEHALLEKFLEPFGLGARADDSPGAATAADCATRPDPPSRRWLEARMGIRPVARSIGPAKLAVDDAIARLCLTYVPPRYAQRFSRKSEELRRVRLRTLLVAEVDWTLSRYGLPCRVAYWATWLPYYECTVVCRSATRPHGFGGYEQLAVGAFGADVALLAGLLHCLEKDTQRVAPRRAEIRRCGLLDRGTANAWSARFR